jgi:hypothetical protein
MHAIARVLLRSRAATPQSDLLPSHHTSPSSSPPSLPSPLSVNPLSRIHPRLHCIAPPSSPNPHRKSGLLESSCISIPRCPLQRSSSSRWARSRAWPLARTGAVSDTSFNGRPVRVQGYGEDVLEVRPGGGTEMRKDLARGFVERLRRTRGRAPGGQRHGDNSR